MTAARFEYVTAWAGPVTQELLDAVHADARSRDGARALAALSAAIDHAAYQLDITCHPASAEAFRRQLRILEQGIPGERR